MDLSYYLKYLQKRGIRSIPKPLDMPVSIPVKTLESSPQTIVQAQILTKKSLTEIQTELGDCKKCRLGEFRTNIVFGEGNPQAELMFIGEGPGEDEDKTGRPFVGKAGQLLDKIIEAMSFKREEVFIANIVKCRPPGNRNPMDDEILACKNFLMEQIISVNPKIIVLLGSPATCTVLDKKIKISGIRGVMIDSITLPHFVAYNNIKIMPTFHPAYLLRNPQDKRFVWEDMKTVKNYLGRG